MGKIVVSGIGKAYKRYNKKWNRIIEWLSVKPVTKHSLKWVIRNISFTINPGESVGIMGVNGAGKSTLLKLITGTTTPTEGSIEFSGKIAALLELGMGFHPDFTGRQNVYMAGQLIGLSTTEINRLIPEIEQFAEIGDYIDEPVRTYSSGMQVRLAFSVATAVRPDILIVDEALSVGDAYFQSKCFKRISDFKDAGTTLLLVTHSVSDVVKHCERALLIDNGRIIADSSAKDVTNKYLDMLFGGVNSAKNKITEKTSNSNEVSTGFYSNGTEDIFHEHPLYNKNEHRWGNGSAKIIDYNIVANESVYPTKINSGDYVDFSFKVHFSAGYERVVPGFLIKTIEGIFLYGTNSFISNKGDDFISVESGDIKIFKFSLPMNLNEGNYLISFGISSGDPLKELTPLDRRYDSVLVYVNRPIQFWGIVDMNANFEYVSV